MRCTDERNRAKFLACLLAGLPSPQTSVPPTQSALRADGTFDNECCASKAKRLPDNAHDCWCTARAPMRRSSMVVATTTGRIVSETYASAIGRRTTTWRHARAGGATPSGILDCAGGAVPSAFRDPIPDPMSAPAHGPARLAARIFRLSPAVSSCRDIPHFSPPLAASLRGARFPFESLLRNRP